jgi:DNA-binding NarL/FixJ family response regulator
MLLDDLDRTFDIESSVETDDVPGIALDRRPRAEPEKEAGAVLPDDAPAELVDAAELLVAAGYRISRADGGDADSGGNGREDIPALSPRELEVLALLAEGAPNKVIARRLDVSVHTAKFHVASIIAKLNATNRTDAMAIAMRRGLVRD